MTPAMAAPLGGTGTCGREDFAVLVKVFCFRLFGGDGKSYHDLRFR
jgi:hypothetical protein